MPDRSCTVVRLVAQDEQPGVRELSKSRTKRGPVLVQIIICRCRSYVVRRSGRDVNTAGFVYIKLETPTVIITFFWSALADDAAVLRVTASTPSQERKMA